MKVLSTILALIVLPIGFSSAPAEADLAPSELSNVTETPTAGLPPLHWRVFPQNACTACHKQVPPIPGGIGRSSDLEELVGAWSEADRLKISD